MAQCTGKTFDAIGMWNDPHNRKGRCHKCHTVMRVASDEMPEHDAPEHDAPGTAAAAPAPEAVTAPLPQADAKILRVPVSSPATVPAPVKPITTDSIEPKL